jgi:tripartite-type tricarboxylate transporter receptor subunit TctC
MMRISAIILFTLATLVSGAAAQEPYPSRPISIVNPFPPGGIADLTARPLAATLERLLKQPVVVVNKAGAAGAVGVQFASVAKPDGYTLLIALVSISSTPEVDKLFGRPATYTRDEFVGIARLNADPPILAVNGPWKTLKELVDDAKKRPGEITFASSGPYGASHLPLVPAAICGAASAGGEAQSSAWLPSTAVVAGPPPVVGRWRILRDATRKAMEDPEFRSAMDKARTPIAYQDADEFKAFWDRDAQRIAAVIQFIGKAEAK